LSVVTTTTEQGKSPIRTLSSTLAVPSVFVAKVATGSRYESRTSACAARWKTKSGRSAVMCRGSAESLRMSTSA
jgi:hypothetical protein